MSSSKSSSPSPSSSSSSSSSSCCQFSLDEIQVATNNFDDKIVLGHGGEGKVYLAEINLNSETKKTRVAVKKLNQNSTEFEKEIETVTKIRHPHLVALLGYCNESSEKILIYEYMEKGSLADYIQKDSAICLSWIQRLNICLGAAYGLQHLHKETDEFRKGIIHRDVKPANILLNENWEAKIADFGMFKLSDSAQINSIISTQIIKGTRGYFAPEYVMSYHITRKIDVYAFGVVMFEVLCRKKPWDRGDVSCYIEENEDLGDWANQNVDIKIKADISNKSLNLFTEAIGRSLRSDPASRPSMETVVQSLESALKLQEREGEHILSIGLMAPREGSQGTGLPPPPPPTPPTPRVTQQAPKSSPPPSSGPERLNFKHGSYELLEIAERAYVFRSCFSSVELNEESYRLYIHDIIRKLQAQFPESSFLGLNFREGEKRSHFANILSECGVTVMDYPRQYNGCFLLPLPLIHQFLHVCESWLMHGNRQVVLLHCERGGWPTLAFLLACFLVYKKLQSGKRKTLEIVYREAPTGLLQLFSPLDPFPSQLRYLQYISRRNLSPEWTPLERALSLDCLILRAIPTFDNQNRCRPLIRIFGRDPFKKDGLSTQMLFSTPKNRLRHYSQIDTDVFKIDIQCVVEGDVVLECVHLDLEPEREVIMFRVMFNTSFIRSNILMLNSEELDIFCDSKALFPKSFRAEILFEVGEGISPAILNGKEKGELPMDAFSRVQELFDGVELDDSTDDASAWLIKQLSVLNDVKELSIALKGPLPPPTPSTPNLPPNSSS